MDMTYLQKKAVVLFWGFTFAALVPIRASSAARMRLVFPFEAVASFKLDADVSFLQNLKGELLDYSISSNDVVQIAASDAYFSLGTAWELSLEKQVKAINANVNFYTITNGCVIRENNPYFWLSPENVSLIRRNIMQQILPGHVQMDCLLQKDLYKQNRYSVVIFHRAYEYLASYFGLATIYIDIEKESNELVRQKLDEARLRGINRAFALCFQPMEKIKKICDLNVVSLNPYSKSCYVEFIRAVVEGINDKDE